MISALLLLSFYFYKTVEDNNRGKSNTANVEILLKQKENPQ